MSNTTWARRRGWSGALIFFSCASALAGACGGSGNDSGGNGPGQGAGPGTGAGATGGSSADALGGSLGGNPAGGDGTTGAGANEGASGQGGAAQGTLVINPPTATITVTDEKAMPTQAFKASAGGTDVAASWVLDSYTVGNIDTNGTFTATGLAAGTANITANFNGAKGTAKVNVVVKIVETVGDASGISPGNQTALTAAAGGGATTTDPQGGAILYPYKGTVFPRGLTAPLVQFSPGSVLPEDAMVTLSVGSFSWSGVAHVTAGATPQLTIPQAVWDGCLQSTDGKENVTLTVTKAAGGQAYTPMTTSFVVAPTTLKGTVYYMTYGNEGNADQRGLWAVNPGQGTPAKQLIKGCVVCHAASADGSHLSAGTYNVGDASGVDKDGEFSIDSTGTLTRLAPIPDEIANDGTTYSTDNSTIGYAAWTPDGAFLLRSVQQFWGGTDTAVWKIDDANKKVVKADLVGADGVGLLLPGFSPDGKKLVFTNGAKGDKPMGTASGSLGTMDVAVDPSKGAAGTVTLSNRRVVFDSNQPAGSLITNFATFLPDSNQVVFQERTSVNPEREYSMPTWSAGGGTYSWAGATGQLFVVDTTTGKAVELKNANSGIVPDDEKHNYEPFPLPVPAGGYFWVVFTSIRQYGNTYQGTSGEGGVRKQLWVAALDPAAPAGTDPSHPAFFLPNQSESTNERGVWAREPCRSDGTTCDSGDECCHGFCRAADPTKPSVLTCSTPPENQCSQDGEACTSASQCCAVATGEQCIGGFCTKPHQTVH